MNTTSFMWIFCPFRFVNPGSDRITRRKCLLGLCTLTGLSGCSGSGGGDSTSPAHTPTVTATRTSTPTEVTPTPTSEEPLAAKYYTEREEAVYRETEDGPLSVIASIPSADGAFPLVVHIHGGAWQQGSAGYPGMEMLARAGIAVASVEYRLTGTAPHPAQIRDVNAAVRWLKANPQGWEIDTDRIALTGGSAGAHLSSLLAAAPNVKKFQPKGFDLEQPPTVDAVVPHYGAYDLRFEDGCGEAFPAPLRKLLDGKCSSEELKAEVSPITHIDNADPAVLLFHGGQDEMVPVEQSRRYRDALEKAGVPVKYHELEGVGHGYLAKKDLVRRTHEQMVTFLNEGPWRD